LMAMRHAGGARPEATCTLDIAGAGLSRALQCAESDGRGRVFQR
jgi:hypothetical protein